MKGFSSGDMGSYERNWLKVPVGSSNLFVFLDLDLYDNGKVKRVILKEETILPNIDGIENRYAPLTELLINHVGHVINASQLP